jgi:hypothetical protein
VIYRREKISYVELGLKISIVTVQNKASMYRNYLGFAVKKGGVERASFISGLTLVQKIIHNVATNCLVQPWFSYYGGR